MNGLWKNKGLAKFWSNFTGLADSFFCVVLNVSHSQIFCKANVGSESQSRNPETSKSLGLAEKNAGLAVSQKSHIYHSPPLVSALVHLLGQRGKQNTTLTYLAVSIHTVQANSCICIPKFDMPVSSTTTTCKHIWLPWTPCHCLKRCNRCVSLQTIQWATVFTGKYFKSIAYIIKGNC